MVALDEELGPAQHPYVGAGSAIPDRVVSMARVPLDQVLDAALAFLVETMLRGLDVPAVVLASRGAGPAEDEAVHLEQVLQVPRRQDVDARRHERVDERVAGHHVVDHAIIERVASDARAAERIVPVALEMTQRGVDGAEIDAPDACGGDDRPLDGHAPDHSMRSSEARASVAISGGRVM